MTSRDVHSKPVDVIVVDDRKEEQDYIRDILKLCGCTAHFYSDYRQAYNALRELVADRLLVQYQLGGRDLGATLLQQLEQDQVDPPTVIMNCDPDARRAVHDFCERFHFVRTIEWKEITTRVDSIRRTFERGAKHPPPPPRGKPTAFVIHGRDVTALQNGTVSSHERLTRILKVNFDLNVVVLQAEPPSGATIIAEIERAFEESSVAIALFTADDVGKLRTARALRRRVRQNVLFETGLARGRLGPQRTIIFQESDDIELPSDLGGVRTLPLSDTDQDIMIALRGIFDGLKLPVSLKVLRAPS